MKTLVIKKRSSEEVAAWCVDCTDVSPNTTLEVEKGVTLLIKADGQSSVSMKSDITLYSVFNPGKDKKLVGGNKPYDKCEIVAIDQSTEFEAEWGLAGSSSVPCTDAEMGIDCNAIAYGSYYYQIVDFWGFLSALNVKQAGSVSRNDLREFLRAQTTNIIKDYLAGKVSSKDMRTCQGEIGLYSSDLQRKINQVLESKGMAVTHFAITSLNYDLAHQAVREKAGKIKADTYIKEIENQGKISDLEVAEKEAKDVITPVLRAQNAKEEVHVVCPRCGEVVEGNGNYCPKCGQPLNKNNSNN